MRLVFAHDHIFYKYKDQMYSSGGLSKEMIERYSSVFGEVDVLSRQIKLNCFDEKLTVASTTNVNFIHVPNFKSEKNFFKIIQAKNIITNTVKNSDYVIARLPSSIGELAVDAAINSGKPYLIEVVACPWDAYWYHSIKGKMLAPFMYYSMKRRVHKSQNTIYVTNEFLQKRYPTKGKSINCSNVALTLFNDEVIERRLKKIENNQKKSKLIIGTTAAVNVKYKGQRYIIEAISKLKKQGITNIEYQLVGGGDQTFLTKVAEKYGVIDQIKFVGIIQHNQVFEWLETIDIYVQPSEVEGLPRALIEAMSRGVPAFGAMTGGIPELLDPKFLFSNTTNKIDEICHILKSINKEIMLKQAKRNYLESKKYDKNLIDDRRRNFFNEFKESKLLVFDE